MSYIPKREREKAQRVETLASCIKDLERMVRNDMRKSDNKTKMIATIVAVIIETAARIGNEVSAEDNKHYGISTLRRKHLRFYDDKVCLSYTGKSGVSQKKTITDPTIMKSLRDLAGDKTSNDFIFSCLDTGIKAKGRDVNNYLKDFGITAKDIRGYGANERMRQALRKDLDRRRLSQDPSERKEYLQEVFQKALVSVANDVGHLPETLRSSYLVPGLEDSFLRDGTILKDLAKKASTAKAVAFAYALLERDRRSSSSR